MRLPISFPTTSRCLHPRSGPGTRWSERCRSSSTRRRNRRRDEFRRIVTDEQLGIPLDETLEVTARRMDSRDMEQVAVVALLQRDAGGNMAEVLDRVIENIRARQEVLRLVRTLTAQGRLRAGSSRCSRYRC